MKTETIELIGGYTDKEGKTHKDVTFGKRLTVKDIIDLDNDPQGANPTQYNDLIRRKMMTKFGDLKLPVALNAVLALNSIDREDLVTAANKFLQTSRGERTSEVRENGEVKLFFGFDVDGTVYDVVEFGNLTTGRDEVEADTLGFGVARQCFLIGRQITKISTSDGLASINGAVSLEKFYALDAEDFNVLRMGAMLSVVAFRLKGKAIQTEQPVSGDASDNERNGNVGNGSFESTETAH